MLCIVNIIPARATPIRSAASPDVASNHRRSLYEVLRVNRNASQLEIKTAYRTLAKLYHPDARSRFMDSTAAKISSPATEAPDCFVEINRAYATLSDPDTRAVYDTNLILRSRPGNFRRPGRPTRRWETDQCW